MDRSVSFENRAISFQNKGRFRLAKKYYLLAYRRYSNQRVAAKALHVARSIGDMNRQLELFDEARSWYKKSQALMAASRLSAVDKKRFRADLFLGIALSDRGLGNYKRALRGLNTTAKTYSKLKDVEGLAYVTWAMGTTARFSGRLDVAEKWLRKSLVLYTRLKDKSGFAYASCGLGGSLRLMGRLRESLATYQQANKIFRQKKDLFGMAYSFCGMGNALRLMGSLKEGRIFSLKAERLYTTLKLEGPLGFVRWALALSYLQGRDISKAKMMIQLAHKNFSHVKDRRGLVYVLLGRGELARAQNLPSAARYFRAAKREVARCKLSYEKNHAVAGLYRTGHPFASLPLSLRRSYCACGVFWPGFSALPSLP